MDNVNSVSAGEKPSLAGAYSPKKSSHVILTRFNVRYVEDKTVASPGLDLNWLRERFILFEKYCFPSVMAQSVQDFRWVLFFDAMTPEPFISKARALVERRPGTFPIFCDVLPISSVQKAVKEVVSDATEWLLTTRLDNDDGLNVDHVATIQAAQSCKNAEVLNCSTGIVLRGNRTYLFKHPSNAFISLSEPFSEFKTVFSITRHIFAHENYPVKQVHGQPQWLQVVHENNISNRVRGWRIPIADAAEGFPVLETFMADAKNERQLPILFENLSFNLIRRLRDLAVANVRRIARIFGLDLRKKAAAKPRHNAQRLGK